MLRRRLTCLFTTNSSLGLPNRFAPPTAPRPLLHPASGQQVLLQPIAIAPYFFTNTNTSSGGTSSSSSSSFIGTISALYGQRRAFAIRPTRSLHNVVCKGPAQAPSGPTANLQQQPKASIPPPAASSYFRSLTGRIRFEYAKTNRSNCTMCGCTIDEGALRVGTYHKGTGDFSIVAWQHPRCYRSMTLKLYPDLAVCEDPSISLTNLLALKKDGGDKDRVAQLLTDFDSCTWEGLIGGVLTATQKNKLKTSTIAGNKGKGKRASPSVSNSSLTTTAAATTVEDFNEQYAAFHVARELLGTLLSPTELHEIIFANLSPAEAASRREGLKAGSSSKKRPDKDSLLNKVVDLVLYGPPKPCSQCPSGGELVPDSATGAYVCTAHFDAFSACGAVVSAEALMRVEGGMAIPSSVTTFVRPSTLATTMKSANGNEEPIAEMKGEENSAKKNSSANNAGNDDPLSLAEVVEIVRGKILSNKSTTPAASPAHSSGSDSIVKFPPLFGTQIIFGSVVKRAVAKWFVDHPRSIVKTPETPSVSIDDYDKPSSQHQIDISIPRDWMLEVSKGGDSDESFLNTFRDHCFVFSSDYVPSDGLTKTLVALGAIVTRPEANGLDSISKHSSSGERGTVNVQKKGGGEEGALAVFFIMRDTSGDPKSTGSSDDLRKRSFAEYDRASEWAAKNGHQFYPVSLRWLLQSIAVRRPLTIVEGYEYFLPSEAGAIVAPPAVDKNWRDSVKVREENFLSGGNNGDPSPAAVSTNTSFSSSSAPPQQIVFSGSTPVDPESGLAASHQVYTHCGLPWSATLSSVDLSTDKNSFYVLQLLTPQEGGASCVLFRRWGRLGDALKGGKTSETFHSVLQAKARFAKYFFDRTANSWDPYTIEHAQKFTKHARKYNWVDPPTAAASALPSSTNEGSIGITASTTTTNNGTNSSSSVSISIDTSSNVLPRATEGLIELLFSEDSIQRSMATMSIDTKKMPLPSLNARAVSEGRQVLRQLLENASQTATTVAATFTAADDKKARGKKAHKKKGIATSTATANSVVPQQFTDRNILSLSNRFYSHIPHVRGASESADSFLLNSPEKISEKFKLLDDLDDILLTKQLMLSQGESVQRRRYDQYAGLKTDLQPLSTTDDEEGKMVATYFKNTHGVTHSKFNLKQVWKVARYGEDSQFAPWEDFHNRRLLWHGSRLTNWVRILSTGLKIAPPDAPVSGYMFGKGIYFADMISKSANYCHISRGDGGLLVLAEVALGTQTERYQSDYITALPKNIHSTYALGRTMPDPQSDLTLPSGVVVPYGEPVRQPNNYERCSLAYNEFIVYDVSQVKIRYLLHVDL